MSARKRKREEQANERPLRSYRIPKTYKLPAILEILESGNVNLYCEVNCIRISKDLLVKTAIVMVICKYRSDNTKPSDVTQTTLTSIPNASNSEPYFIAVEKSDFLNGLKGVNGFEDHLTIVSYNNHWKEVATSRVTAMLSSEEPILHDPGEEIQYKGSLKISGKSFSDKIPKAGKQLKLDFETDKNRLRLTTSAPTQNLETSKFIDLPNVTEDKKVDSPEGEEEYRDAFGENSTKLLTKIIDLFKENSLLLKFDLGVPIHISGTFEKLETLTFYMAGKILDDDE